MSFSLQAQSQASTIKLKGVVKDSIENIVYANIINLKTKDGTFTNDYGQFTIKVQLGDSLFISSVQHKPLKYKITKKDIENKHVLIYLKLNRLELDEVVVKNTQLTGSLSIDYKKRQTTKSEKKKSELQKLLENAPTSTTIEPIGSQPADRGLAGEITKKVDPTKSYRGLGFGLGLGFLRRKNKTKIRIQQLEKKQQFYNKVIRIAQIEFFKTINIPKNLITHFLSFCDRYELEKFIEKNETLEMMKYLKKTSVSYLNQRKPLTKD